MQRVSEGICSFSFHFLSSQFALLQFVRVAPRDVYDVQNQTPFIVKLGFIENVTTVEGKKLHVRQREKEMRVYFISHYNSMNLSFQRDTIVARVFLEGKTRTFLQMSSRYFNSLDYGVGTGCFEDVSHLEKRLPAIIPRTLIKRPVTSAQDGMTNTISALFFS